METKKYQEALTKELEQLEKQLNTVGRINLDNPADWETIGSKETNIDDDHSDQNDNADAQEEFGERHAILQDLEIRYNNVKQALERIKDNTFGKCQVCEKNIEPERLKANPAATTCLEHTRQ